MMLTTLPKHFRQVRSFVRRDSRTTPAQREALANLLPRFGILSDELIDFDAVFQRSAPRLVEIGFGMGHSLLSAAKAHPDKDFIGIETHQPGLGSLLLAIEADEVPNLRLIYADSVSVFAKAIRDQSLQGVQLFFPDPWPKRRHHVRRIIQTSFLQCILQKLAINGTLHLATDWEDYATHMLQVIAEVPDFHNLAGDKQFSDRSIYRPIITKFEARAISEDRIIRDIQLQKKI